MKKFHTYNLTKIGLMAAIVMAATFFRIQVPISGVSTMLHLGNAACLLAGILLGPIDGALAASIGVTLFDILNPIYLYSAPFTFIFKFIMVFICGKFAYMKGNSGQDKYYNITGATLGSITYMLLRTVKSFIINTYLLHIPLTTVIIILLKSLVFSIINSIAAVIISVTLASLIKHRINP